MNECPDSDLDPRLFICSPRSHRGGVPANNAPDAREVACGWAHGIHRREQFVTFLLKPELGIISTWQVHELFLRGEDKFVFLPFIMQIF